MPFCYKSLAVAFACAALSLHGGWPVCAHAQGVEQSVVSVSPSQRAIELARASRYDEALALLRPLREAMPQDAALLYDETVILSWAERDELALANAAQIDLNAAPAYVLLAIGKSARNQRRFDDAARWYRKAVEREPRNVDAMLGLALVEADRGDATAAQAALAKLSPEASNTMPVLLAKAYVAQQTGHGLDALRWYELALEREPGNRTAARGKALTLRALLLPTQALEFVAERQGILSDAELARLRADEVALRVRLVTSTPYPPAQRAGRYAQTLAALDRSLATTTDAAARASLRSDRVVALAYANRSREAIAEFQQLSTEIASPPFEALAAAAHAHLDVGDADDAVQLLLAARAVNPSDLEVRFDLVFAYLAAERPKQALQTAYALQRELSLLNVGPGAHIVKGNPIAQRAAIVTAVAEAYADRLASAQRRLEAILAASPGDAEARRELANVYRWRGWLERSKAQYRQALAIDPESIEARAGYAHTLLDAFAFDEAKEIAAALSSVDPGDPVARRLVKRWRLEQRSELSIDYEHGRASGATFGAEQQGGKATWLSQPFGQWRALAQLEYASADFPEGVGHLRRVGGGADYREQYWNTAVMLTRATDSGQVGALALGDVRLGDIWRLGAWLDLDSSETPLRGRRVGLQTNVAGARAEWNPRDDGGVSIEWRHRQHSDGNRGEAYFAQGWRRLFNAPSVKLDATVEMAAARNRTDQVPYFSPRHDLFAVAGLRNTWRIYRRNERSIEQAIDVDGGRYDQAGFKSAAAWRASYRLRVESLDAFRADLGVRRSRMVYDGVPEYATTFMLDLTARL